MSTIKCLEGECDAYVGVVKHVCYFENRNKKKKNKKTEQMNEAYVFPLKNENRNIMSNEKFKNTYTL